MIKLIAKLKTRRSLMRTLSNYMFFLFIFQLAVNAAVLRASSLKQPFINKAEERDYWPTTAWRTALLSAHGLDESLLNQLVDKITSGDPYRAIHSLLIVKNGYLVFEKYFAGYDKDDLHTLQSVTKSIASTLVGAAIQNGFIQSLDQKVLSFFPEYETVANLDENKRVMNLRHALTMQTGMAWFGEKHLGPLNRFSGDKMKFVLDYEMDRPPGEKWYYNSGIAVLLGGLLQNATGMGTIEFADKFLFQPLGVSERRWYSHRGIPHSGGGLHLRPRDMTKIGFLFLNDGAWDGKRILPEGWVEEATQRHVPFAEKKSEYTAAYGYMWWVLPYERHNLDKREKQDFFAAYGYMGQFIFVIPEHDMVVVVTGGAQRWPDEIRPFDFLYRFILKAVEQ